MVTETGNLGFVPSEFVVTRFSAEAKMFFDTLQSPQVRQLVAELKELQRDNEAQMKTLNSLSPKRTSLFGEYLF